MDKATDIDEGAVTKFKQECDKDKKFMEQCILALPWTAPYAPNDVLARAWARKSNVYDKVTSVTGITDYQPEDKNRVIGKCAKTLENYIERKTFHR